MKPFLSKANIDVYEVRERGFKAFVEIAWPQIIPESITPNWHIDELVDVLDGIARNRKAGIPSETSISVPPASTKSSIACILWQPWVWTFWPESKWISTTYEAGLAQSLSAKSRDLVRSGWYQARWPIKLKKDAEGHWENEVSGFRIALGIGGATTGKHAHFQIGDDLLKEQDVRIGSSMKIRGALERASGFWFGTMGTREVNPGKTAKVLIGQRLAVKDPPGIAIDDYGYEAVVFPAHFDPDRVDSRDHRGKDEKGNPLTGKALQAKRGELLCEARQDEEALKALAIRLGPQAASAQLEQAPVPAGGAIIKKEYLSNRYAVLPPRIRRAIEEGRQQVGQKWISAWDLAFKGEVSSDWVVGQIWCKIGGSLYLVDQIREQMGFRDSILAINDLSGRYPFVVEHIFEDAANAPAIVDLLAAEIPGMLLEPHGGGCLARTQFCLGIWASGAINLPSFSSWMKGSDGFVVEHMNFSGLKSDTDDQVAASSLAIKYLVGGNVGINSFIKAMNVLGTR